MDLRWDQPNTKPQPNLNNSPTLRRWVLLEKPADAQPHMNFSEFYGTRRFITLFLIFRY
jgi:hypothetical protein